MKSVLLTGASGFIGHHCLAPLLALGYEVHAVSSKPQEQSLPGVTWYQADLLDLSQIAPLMARVKPTHLLHLAWHVVPGSFGSPENLAWVQSSLELLRQFSEQGGKRVVVAGTCYEYDWNYGYCSESVTPRLATTFYGSCKNALYDLVAAYSERIDLSMGWGRIFFLYGPREHPNRLVSSVIRSLLLGEPALCSHGEQIRDYLSVEDTAGATVALLNSNVQGPVNIASGLPIALKDIILTIGERLDKVELIRLGALPARANDAPLVVADVRRLTTEVGWQPSHDLTKGLGQTINWWKQQVGI
jgi:nucleoside-diphosphate-sugar epimerase